MKAAKLPSIFAGGVNQKLRPSPDDAGNIINMRYDSKLSWVGDRGFEPLIITDNQAESNERMFNEIERLYVYNRHNGAETWVLEKHEDGSIYSRVHNPASPVRYHLIGAGRKKPTVNDPGEQFVPCDRFLLILNGQDDMLKYYGQDYTTRFGFTTPTPSPEVLGVSPVSWASSDPEMPAPGTTALLMDDKITGLGIATQGATNTYRYRISFIRDTGSESPVSSPIEVSWEDLEDNKRFGVSLINIPLGPPGTVARRIYRTRNLREYSQAGQTVYYFVDEIKDNLATSYTDISPDSLLTLQAPNPSDSITISNSYKFATNWNGHVWLAGRTSDDLTIRYSKRGLPEQFGAFDFFTVGSQTGGQITGLFAYNDNLFVFRQHAIEIIRSRGNGDTYSISTLTTDVGTEAINTVKAVPKVGVLFLSYDGIYAITGSTLGGGRLNVVKISDAIFREIERINPNALPRATAVYSQKEEEYWCHFAVDGSDKNNLGCVFHPEIAAWSFRNIDIPEHTLPSNAGVVNATTQAINDLAVLPNGWIIAAFEKKYEDLTGSLSYYINPGVNVWSGKNSAGHTATASLPFGGENFRIYRSVELPSLNKTWESTWNPFGDDGLTAQVFAVTIGVIARGNNELTLSTATNWQDIFGNEQTQPLAPPAEYNSDASMHVMAPINNQVIENPIVIGQSRYQGLRAARLRYDVSSQHVTSFKFKVESNKPFSIIDYQIEFKKSNATSIQTIKAKAQGNN